MEKESKRLIEIIESQERQVELDEKELRRYIDVVINEVKKEERAPDL